MPLKTVVKVGNISNLSDARYCSGMGVDMLGFGVIEGEPGYLAPKLFQEIRGWVSGPKVVAELYGIKSHHVLDEIMAGYAPDYFEMGFHEYQRFAKQLPLPCLVSVKKEEVIEIKPDYDHIPYLLLDEEAMIAELKTKSLHYPLLLKVSASDNLNEKLHRYPLSGIALHGSAEIRPGFKDYADLSEILELLDE